MAETMQSLEELSTLKPPAAPRGAEICAEARQAGPRLCHRQTQGRGRARLDQARRRQDRHQRPGRWRPILRGRCCACSSSSRWSPPTAGPVRRDLHRLGRRPFRPGRRGAPRLLQGADAISSRTCAPCSSAAASSPAIRAWSSARSTARQGAPQLPVLQALNGHNALRSIRPAMLLPSLRICVARAPAEARARVAAAPRIVTRETNIRNNFSILFRENAGLIFCAYTAKKAVPIFRRILRRRKKCAAERRTGRFFSSTALGGWLRERLCRIVHLVFDRMRRVLEADHFLIFSSI